MDRIFVGLVIILGLLFTFLVPPFQKPDEVVHYYRSVALSRGQFKCLGDGEKYFSIPKLNYELPYTQAYKDIAFNYSEKYSFELFRRPQNKYSLVNEPLEMFKNYCVLSFWGYIPSAFGLTFGKIIGLSPILSFYLGRIVPFILFILVLSYSIKTIKKDFRFLLIVFASLPIVVHQAGSFSYDSIQFSLIILIFTLLTKFESNSNVSFKNLIILLFSLVIFIQVKPGYQLFVFLAMVVNITKIKIINKKILVFTYFTYFVLAAVSVYITATNVKLTQEGGYSERYVVPNIQISLLREFPERLFFVVSDTISLVGNEYLEGMIGILGWKDYSVSNFVMFTYLIGFGVALRMIIKSKRKKFCWRSFFEILFLLIIIIGTFFAIFASLYIAWTHTTNPYVEGVQGRYFLPLVPLVFLTVYKINRLFGYKPMIIIICLLVFFSLTKSVYNRYFDRSSYVREVFNHDNLTDSKLVQYNEIKDKLKIFIYENQIQYIRGFQMVILPDPKLDTVYIYELKDGNCKNTYSSGVLLQETLRKNNIILQKFKEQKRRDAKYCFILSPFNPGERKLKVGYNQTENNYMLRLAGY